VQWWREKENAKVVGPRMAEIRPGGGESGKRSQWEKAGPEGVVA